MRTTIVVALVALLMLAVVPFARANEPQIAIIDGAKDRSHAYVEFFVTFNTALIELLKNGERQAQNRNLAPNHWVILMSPILSTTGDTLVTIIAIRDGDESELPVLIAVLNERSEAATVRTAAKSAHRLLIETATRQRETPPSPPQKLKTKNLRTKQRAEVSISCAIVGKYE